MDKENADSAAKNGQPQETEANEGGTDSRVWPDPTDADLFQLALADIEQRYPDRFDEKHIFASFAAACAEYDDYVSAKRLIKKTRMKCVWGRPIIPPELLQQIEDNDV